MRKVFIISTLLLSAINLYSQKTMTRYSVWQETDSTWREFRYQIDSSGHKEIGVKVDTAWQVWHLADDEWYPWFGEPQEFFWDEIIVDFRTDLMFNNFDAFESVLGKHNTDYMNRSSWLIIALGFSGTKGRHLVGFNLGISPIDYINRHDSLDITHNLFRFGVNYGFNLVNSGRFSIAPRAAVHWNRHRLINSGKDHISLSQYLSDRCLDIRFNQLTGFLGLSLTFVEYFTNRAQGTTGIGFGLYGGYIVNLNAKPWIYSVGRSLHTDHKIDLRNYTFGLNISFRW
jgi:hypothetical protein